MKNCEYFEKLMSDSLDNKLASKLENELSDHLNSCRDCYNFKKEVQLLSGKIQNLTQFKFSDNFEPVKIKPEKSFLTKIWEMKISVPLPVAATIIFLFLSFSLYNFLYNNELNNQNQLIELQIQNENSKEVKYVSIEKLAPSEAIQIDIEDLGGAL